MAPLAGAGLDRLQKLGPLEIDPWIDHVPVKLHSAAELIDRLKGIDVLLVEADHIPSAVIESSELNVIGTCRGDPVNVDIDAATAAGIAVLRAPGRNARAVAELALALTLALMRSIISADDEIRGGRWVIDQKLAQQRYKGRELASLTIGVIGFGAVGREAAALFKALGSKVIVCDPYVTDAAGYDLVSLEDLLRKADVISLHAAVTPETKGMIGSLQIEMTKPGVMLVNTARFGLLEESPLVAALQSGHIKAAAFDHFTNEFLPADHPLTSMPNVILTPHIGGTTFETIERHTTMIADGLEALLRGDAPSNLVNPECLQLFKKRMSE
ncbi:MAG: NAD(P)-dependent oxidoreductase [Actinomycetota bacterium]